MDLILGLMAAAAGWTHMGKTVSNVMSLMFGLYLSVPGGCDMKEFKT
jgi:hypothetical protein